MTLVHSWLEYLRCLYLRTFHPLKVMSVPETPFLCFWSGEIVRHMGRPHGDSFLCGCVVDAGRDFVIIQWEDNLDRPERITDPAALVKIIKQPMPSYAQL